MSSFTEAEVEAGVELARAITDLCDGKDSSLVMSALVSVVAKVVAVYELTKPGAGSKALDAACAALRDGGEAMLDAVSELTPESELQ
jgi:hypothetical protein